MRLQNITATPRPSGNSIDLSWVNPNYDQYPGIRIVRREATHPTLDKEGAGPRLAEYGVVVADGKDLPCVVTENGDKLYVVTDENLKGDTVYYYTLFPYRGDPPEYQFDRHNRTATMATSPYNMAGQMYDLLPGIYHRYDTMLPNPHDVAEADEQKGQLRRFLDLLGSQLDRLYGLARAMLDLYDVVNVDGRLLPLLAEWIGWQTDYRQEFDTQRNEIKSAPYVYRTIGIIPTVEATVKRILGWECRTKEFAHNVFLSNRPERLNLWARKRDSTGEWSDPREPLSLDFAYEGRPTAVQDRDGVLWLFYHTLRNDRWDIWYKTYTEGQGWTPSQPLTHRTGFDRHPTAVVWCGTLWVFWDVYNEPDRTWHIDYRCRGADGEWSTIHTFGDGEPERRQPWAVADRKSGWIWLFWLERSEAGWLLKYSRRDDPLEDATSVRSFLQSASTFPSDDGGKSVQSDLFVFADEGARLWVFWARRVKAPSNESGQAEPQGEESDPARASSGEPDPTTATVCHPNQTRWQIAYRLVDKSESSVDGWSPVYTLLEEPSDYDCRAPAAVWNRVDDAIELFWSSNQDGSWSIWRGTLNGAALESETVKRITGNLYSQRTLLPVSIADGTLLIYRANNSPAYASTVYSATTTIDFRYAGCTTADTRNAAKLALQEQYEDFQTYTYDTGLRNGKQPYENWYAPDRVGVYLSAHTEEQQLITRNRRFVEGALQQFLPIQVRTVFIIDVPTVHKDQIYTYAFPEAEPQRRIGEGFYDEIDSIAVETYSGLADRYQDAVPDWVWVCSWSKAKPDHRTVDFAMSPIDTRLRTWHVGVTAGG